MFGYSANAGSALACNQYLTFAPGQWTLALAQGCCSQPWIDDALPSDDTPDVSGQPLCRRVLQEKTCSPALHGPPQITRTPKGGKDHTATGRQRSAQSGSRTDAIHPWHLNIEKGNIRLGGEGNFHHSITTFDLRHHGDILLHGE